MTKLQEIICGAFMWGVSVADIARNLKLSRQVVENAIREGLKR